MSARALLVDDEPDELALLTAHLRRGGLVVYAVGSAEDALAAEPSLQLDVALVDLRLPGISGWDLVAALRVRRPDLPIVVTSVLDTQDYPAVEGHLAKPFQRDDVWRVLADVLPGWNVPQRPEGKADISATGEAADR